MEMYPGIKKNFKSAARLDSDDFLAIFKIFEHWISLRKSKVL